MLHALQTGLISRYDEKGRGVFEADGKDVAVPFTALGDTVAATVVRRKRGMHIAKLDQIVTPGPDRVAAPCPHAGICGGCLWQHLSYDAQLNLKREMVNRAFLQAGHLERVPTIIPAVEQFHHRNRMDYVVGWKGEIGLKEYGSWSRYVDLTTCLLLNDGVGEILQRVRDWMRACDLQPWDAKFHRGDVRYVIIREGKNTYQQMIVVVVKDISRVTDEMKRRVLDSLMGAGVKPAPTSIMIGQQSLITDVSLAQKFETLIGTPWLEEIVNDITYRIHPNSFFQTNTQMAAKLQEIVGERLMTMPTSQSASRSTTFCRGIGTADRILDLYCGLGFFGIFLAKNNPSLRVHGVEIDADAIELAKHNAAVNGVAERCDFVAAKSEDLSWRAIPADVVILDPPRSGLHPRVIQTLIAMRPKMIIYVSCNYQHLVQELKQFKEHYAIERLTAIDLFPHTPHVEVIAKLVAPC